jgi:hypothetical protein
MTTVWRPLPRGQDAHQRNLEFRPLATGSAPTDCAAEAIGKETFTAQTGTFPARAPGGRDRARADGHPGAPRGAPHQRGGGKGQTLARNAGPSRAHKKRPNTRIIFGIGLMHRQSRPSTRFTSGQMTWGTASSAGTESGPSPSSTRGRPPPRRDDAQAGGRAAASPPRVSRDDEPMKFRKQSLAMAPPLRECHRTLLAPEAEEPKVFLAHFRGQTHASTLGRPSSTRLRSLQDVIEQTSQRNTLPSLRALPQVEPWPSEAKRTVAHGRRRNSSNWKRSNRA